jgi:hypothetical protein
MPRTLSAESKETKDRLIGPGDDPPPLNRPTCAMSFDSQAEDRDAEEASPARGDRPHTSTDACSIRVTNRSRLHAGYVHAGARPFKNEGMGVSP